MQRRVNPLNPLLGKIEKFEQSEIALRQWESKRVDWTIRRLGLTAQLKEVASYDDGDFLSFEAFNSIFSFPVYLTANQLKDRLPLHKDQKSIHPNWFKAFSKLPFVQLFAENLKTYGSYRHAVGMVFPRKGFAQGMIVHTGDFNTFVLSGASCHFYRSVNDLELVVQPYTDFVDALKTTL